MRILGLCALCSILFCAHWLCRLTGSGTFIIEEKRGCQRHLWDHQGLFQREERIHHD